MKKILVIIGVILFLLSINYNNKEEVFIPKDSIRFRIVSNSMNEVDLKTKQELKSYIEDYVYDIVSDAKSSEEADELLVNNLEKIGKHINQYLNSNNYKIDYGINYFPRKVYKGFVYEEGMYKSLVITLGDGKGSNWWCVLFPPLCLLDENETTADVDYQLYVARIIKVFN
ncbi:MAG: stage II sporulation protein R [Bacilli bacterium]